MDQVLATAMGSCALATAAAFVVVHYFRERERRKRLKMLNNYRWPWLSEKGSTRTSTESLGTASSVRSTSTSAGAVPSGFNRLT